MKNVFIIIFLVANFIKIQAQNEIGSKPRPILPPKTLIFNIKKSNTNTAFPKQTNTPITKIAIPNLFQNPNLNAKQSFLKVPKIELKGNFSMSTKNDFANPSDEIKNKLNSKNKLEAEMPIMVYRKNQNLGSFKTKSKKIRVLFRDFGEVDGDVIKTLLNDIVIIPEVELKDDFFEFEIQLLQGFNKIDIQALTQGLYGPNTAEYQILDEKNNVISASQWNLGTGFKATVVITKE
jgi:hypothetical protein